MDNIHESFTLNESHDPDHIRKRIINAVEMRDKYDLEFKELCIKHSMTVDFQDETNRTKKMELLRNYMESKYYKL
jgi:hypothetical protein